MKMVWLNRIAALCIMAIGFLFLLSTAGGPSSANDRPSPNLIPQCRATNITASQNQNANNPTFTKNPDGSTAFKELTYCSFSCTDGASSGCAACGSTRWYVNAPGQPRGPWANGGTPTAAVKSGDCSATNGVWTDTVTIPPPDGNTYTSIYGYAPANSNGSCPDPTTAGNYTGFGGTEISN